MQNISPSAFRWNISEPYYCLNTVDYMSIWSISQLLPQLMSLHKCFLLLIRSISSSTSTQQTPVFEHLGKAVQGYTSKCFLELLAICRKNFFDTLHLLTFSRHTLSYDHKRTLNCFISEWCSIINLPCLEITKNWLVFPAAFFFPVFWHVIICQPRNLDQYDLHHHQPFSCINVGKL